jgi:hypothetical protein
VKGLCGENEATTAILSRVVIPAKRPSTAEGLVKRESIDPAMVKHIGGPAFAVEKLFPLASPSAVEKHLAGMTLQTGSGGRRIVIRPRHE